MKFFFSLLLCAVTQTSFSQVNKVTIQASGLTCSMCSNSINKSLKTIPYVATVYSNIKTSSFDLTFKPGAEVNFDDFKKKVEDAGFYIAGLSAEVNFQQVKLDKDAHIRLGNLNLHVLKSSDQAIAGARTIKLLDKGFVTDKEYKKNASLTSMACYKSGKTATCCKEHGMENGSRIYHVSI